MKILALETTDLAGSVVAMDGYNLLLELELNPKQRSAQSLAPGIKNLLDRVGWKPADVQLVAVAVGPGSFTGLRVGVATAKTFAYAVGAEVLGVDTLETIAQAAPTEIAALTAVVDAQRGELVSGDAFVRDAEGWFVPAGEQKLIDIEQWLSSLPPGTVVSGPMLRKLAGRLPAGIVPLDERYWPPWAGNVARLAQHHYAAGRRDDLWKLVPRYSRQSAAEERWREKNG